MAKVTLNDLQFYYEISGSGDEALVLIAGLSCDNSHWNLVKEKLAKHYTLICPDNRGVGRTEVPEGNFTISDMASDVAQLLNYLNINKANVVGHSMGGAIAQAIAYEFPEIVNKLVISNSFCKFKTRSLIFMNTLASMYLNNLPLEKTVPVNVPWVFSNQFLSQENIIDNMIEIKKAYPYCQSPRGFALQLAAITEFNSLGWVGKIKSPTLIIAGEEDYLTPVDDSKYMHSVIQNSKFILNRGAHVPMIETSEEFTQEILTFLI